MSISPLPKQIPKKHQCFLTAKRVCFISGLQLPVFDLRSDGSDNFVTSLLMAGNYCIPEVTILFHNKLLRGNRTVKVDCESFAAFDSPNLSPLATIGIDINGTYTQRNHWRDGMAKFDTKLSLIHRNLLFD